MYQESPPLSAVGERATMHQYVLDSQIEFQIITLVPPHLIYTFDGTKLLKELPNEIKEKLNPDMDVKVFRPTESGWRQIFDRGNFLGTLKEEQNIDTITILDYFKDHPSSEDDIFFKLLVVWVPRQK